MRLSHRGRTDVDDGTRLPRPRNWEGAFYRAKRLGWGRDSFRAPIRQHHERRRDGDLWTVATEAARRQGCRRGSWVENGTAGREGSGLIDMAITWESEELNGLI